MSFKTELEDLINKHSIENDSNTPDFILANFINKCLMNFADAVNARDCWYSRNPKFDVRSPTNPELDVYTTCNSKKSHHSTFVSLFKDTYVNE